MSKKTKTYILLFTIGLFVLLLFNTSHKGTITQTQKQYQSLLSNLVVEINNSIQNQEKLHGYKITLSHRAVGGSVAWIFPSQNSTIDSVQLPVLGQKLLRLVRLLDESQVYTENASSNGPFEVEFISPNGTYTSSFRPSDLDSNPALRNFVQLIKLFGTPK